MIEDFEIVSQKVYKESQFQWNSPRNSMLGHYIACMNELVPLLHKTSTIIVRWRCVVCFIMNFKCYLLNIQNSTLVDSTKLTMWWFAHFKCLISRFIDVLASSSSNKHVVSLMYHEMILKKKAEMSCQSCLSYLGCFVFYLSRGGNSLLFKYMWHRKHNVFVENCLHVQFWTRSFCVRDLDLWPADLDLWHTDLKSSVSLVNIHSSCTQAWSPKPK